jgi:hypothetical protein
VNSPFGQNYVGADPGLAAAAHASPAVPSAAPSVVHGSGQKESTAANAQQGGEYGGAVAAAAGSVVEEAGNGVPQ